MIRKVMMILSAFMGLFTFNMAAQELPENTTDYSRVQVTAEPESILTQHWAMPTLTNPGAVATDTTFIRIRGGARLEYLGSHQSPKDYLLAADSPFKLMGKFVGAGVILKSTSFYLYNNLNIAAQGSYKFKFGKSMLSVGVQVGYYRTSFKGSELVITNRPGGDQGEGNAPGDGAEGGEVGDNPESGDIEDEPYDQELPTQDVAGGAFDMAVGIRFDHPMFYVGVSAQHLTNPELRLKKENESATDLQYMRYKVPTTLYFDAGGNIAINNSLFTLQPSIILATDFSDFHGVAVMRATYNKKFTFGVDYRWNRAAGVIAGLTIKNFYLGYSWEYDYALSPKGSTGNHELVLGYQFKLDLGGKSNFSQRSIRIM